MFTTSLRLGRLVGAASRRRAADGTGELPIDAPSPRRARTRRGGPRTPLPLIMLIALACGVGVAYVSQSAYATQATYQASAMQQEQIVLQQQSSHLDDQLERLNSVERVIAAAQKLGMKPSSHWSSVPSDGAVFTAPAVASAPQSNATTPLEQVLDSLRGSFDQIEGGAS